MGVEHRSVGGAEVRSVDEEKRQVDARAVVYNVVDSYGSVWRPGCFTRSLERKKPSVVWGHDWLDPIGKVIDYRDGPEGLDVTIQLDDFDAVPRARQAFAQFKSGSLTDFSFGFRRVDGGDTRDVDKDAYPGAREYMTDVDMDEISPVLVGAVPGTAVTGVRKLSTVLSVSADLLQEDPADAIFRYVRWAMENPEEARAAIQEARAKQAPPTGAMVALVPDAASAAVLAVGAYPADQLHLTLSYLGDAVDLPAAERNRIVGAVTSWAAYTPPVTATVSGTGHLGPDDMPVVLVESAGLGYIVCELTEHAPSANAHPHFVPHVSVGDSGDEPSVGYGTAVTFDRVRVAFADEVTDIPLTGEPDLKVSDVEEPYFDYDELDTMDRW